MLAEVRPVQRLPGVLLALLITGRKVESTKHQLPEAGQHLLFLAALAGKLEASKEFCFHLFGRQPSIWEAAEEEECKWRETCADYYLSIRYESHTGFLQVLQSISSYLLAWSFKVCLCCLLYLKTSLFSFLGGI